MSEFNYQIVKQLAVLKESKGYTLEVNVIDYGRNANKYDIRRWDRRNEEAPKMLKGITLTKEEFELLQDFFRGEQ